MSEQMINMLLECSVCMKRMDRTSRVLPCQHTFCYKCLKLIFARFRKLHCPECHSVHSGTLDDLPENLILNKLLDSLSPSVYSEKDIIADQSCAHALYSYSATSDDELSFEKNDMFLLLSHVDENWLFGELNGVRGFIPLAFVKVIIPLPRPQCTALFNFQLPSSELSDSIPLKKGQVVDVIRRVDENWIEGKKDGVVGLFPSNFVELNETARQMLRLQIISNKDAPVECQTPHIQHLAYSSQISSLPSHHNDDKTRTSQYNNDSGVIIAPTPSSQYMLSPQNQAANIATTKLCDKPRSIFDNIPTIDGIDSTSHSHKSQISPNTCVKNSQCYTVPSGVRLSSEGLNLHEDYENIDSLPVSNMQNQSANNEILANRVSTSYKKNNNRVGCDNTLPSIIHSSDNLKITVKESPNVITCQSPKFTEDHVNENLSSSSGSLDNLLNNITEQLSVPPLATTEIIDVDTFDSFEVHKNCIANEKTSGACDKLLKNHSPHTHQDKNYYVNLPEVAKVTAKDIIASPSTFVMSNTATSKDNSNNVTESSVTPEHELISDKFLRSFRHSLIEAPTTSSQQKNFSQISKKDSKPTAIVAPNMSFMPTSDQEPTKQSIMTQQMAVSQQKETRRRKVDAILNSSMSKATKKVDDFSNEKHVENVSPLAHQYENVTAQHSRLHFSYKEMKPANKNSVMIQSYDDSTHASNLIRVKSYNFLDEVPREEYKRVKFIALFNYVATCPEELSMLTGHQYRLIDRHFNGWVTGISLDNEQIGLMPEKYLKPYKPPLIDDSLAPPRSFSQSFKFSPINTAHQQGANHPFHPRSKTMAISPSPTNPIQNNNNDSIRRPPETFRSPLLTSNRESFRRSQTNLLDISPHNFQGDSFSNNGNSRDMMNKNKGASVDDIAVADEKGVSRIKLLPAIIPGKGDTTLSSTIASVNRQSVRSTSQYFSPEKIECENETFTNNEINDKDVKKDNNVDVMHSSRLSLLNASPFDIDDYNRSATKGEKDSNDQRSRSDLQRNQNQLAAKHHSFIKAKPIKMMVSSGSSEESSYLSYEDESDKIIDTQGTKNELHLEESNEHTKNIDQNQYANDNEKFPSYVNQQQPIRSPYQLDRHIVGSSSDLQHETRLESNVAPNATDKHAKRSHSMRHASFAFDGSTPVSRGLVDNDKQPRIFQRKRLSKELFVDPMTLLNMSSQDLNHPSSATNNTSPTKMNTSDQSGNFMISHLPPSRMYASQRAAMSRSVDGESVPTVTPPRGPLELFDIRQGMITSNPQYSDFKNISRSSGSRRHSYRVGFESQHRRNQPPVLQRKEKRVTSSENVAKRLIMQASLNPNPASYLLDSTHVENLRNIQQEIQQKLDVVAVPSHSRPDFQLSPLQNSENAHPTRNSNYMHEVPQYPSKSISNDYISDVDSHPPPKTAISKKPSVTYLNTEERKESSSSQKLVSSHEQALPPPIISEYQRQQKNEGSHYPRMNNLPQAVVTSTPTTHIDRRPAIQQKRKQQQQSYRLPKSQSAHGSNYDEDGKLKNSSSLSQHYNDHYDEKQRRAHPTEYRRQGPSTNNATVSSQDARMRQYEAHRTYKPPSFLSRLFHSTRHRKHPRNKLSHHSNYNSNHNNKMYGVDKKRHDHRYYPSHGKESNNTTSFQASSLVRQCGSLLCLTSPPGQPRTLSEEESDEDEFVFLIGGQATASANNLLDENYTFTSPPNTSASSGNNPDHHYSQSKSGAPSFPERTEDTTDDKKTTHADVHSSTPLLHRQPVSRQMSTDTAYQQLQQGLRRSSRIPSQAESIPQLVVALKSTEENLGEMSGERYRCIREYHAKSESELSMNRGSIIIIHGLLSNDWLFGTNMSNFKAGMLPRQNVTRCESKV